MASPAVAAVGRQVDTLAVALSCEMSSGPSAFPTAHSVTQKELTSAVSPPGRRTVLVLSFFRVESLHPSSHSIPIPTEGIAGDVAICMFAGRKSVRGSYRADVLSSGYAFGVMRQLFCQSSPTAGLVANTSGATNNPAVMTMPRNAT